MMESIGLWIGIVSGILGIVGFIAQFWPLMKPLKNKLGGNKFILVLLTLSLLMSATSIYISRYRPSSIVVTSSAYQPLISADIKVVKDQTIADTDVPLDGYDYDNVTFQTYVFYTTGLRTSFRM
jgi:hypothetical protein